MSGCHDCNRPYGHEHGFPDLINEEVLADKRRLTRELDAALSGEDGAAKQASLCDLIEPARLAKRALDIVTILANTPPKEWLSKPEIHAALNEFRKEPSP